LEEVAPPSSGVPNDQLGFVYGDPMASVTGVGCVWCCHAASIHACAEHGLDMVICHEALWLPGQVSPWYDGPPEAEIHSNLLRRKLLDEHRMVVYRSHSNWDALPKLGVADSAVAALRLEGARVVARQKYFAVQELAEETSVQALRKIVEGSLEFRGTRLFGDAAKRVKRFAFLIGGFGENQFHMPQAARDMGAEAIIIGEMSEFIVISCIEMGMPVIETLHSVSEIPGIRSQARFLAGRFPALRVEYLPSGALSFE
jgi:putative NIF3 family GTP cyclohydrolase 1 type 2